MEESVGKPRRRWQTPAVWPVRGPPAARKARGMMKRRRPQGQAGHRGGEEGPGCPQLGLSGPSQDLTWASFT